MLRLYAVDIWQDPPQSWGPGRGVYLGKGLVLTVAHVIGSVARTKPNVRIADMDLPARAIREGNVENVDLTLLSIDEQKLPIYLQMRRMPLVKGPHGRASMSLSRFPKKRRARMSCHRCHFLFRSQENSPR
jgi:hypothetical protein